MSCISVCKYIHFVPSTQINRYSTTWFIVPDRFLRVKLKQKYILRIDVLMQEREDNSALTINSRWLSLVRWYHCKNYSMIKFRALLKKDKYQLFIDKFELCFYFLVYCWGLQFTCNHLFRQSQFVGNAYLIIVQSIIQFFFKLGSHTRKFLLNGLGKSALSKFPFTC